MQRRHKLNLCVGPPITAALSVAESDESTEGTMCRAMGMETRGLT